ncbi:unnamed protein product [Somion occarium]|uniref:polynucleotide adenylyltransferase n=1 Tax=Somion occarium TaxID=3059160 RepID=A0ABP1CQX9_9APHY
MTAVYSQRLQPLRQHTHQAQQPLQTPIQRQTSKQRFVSEFSRCLFDFVIQLLPTTEELTIKEDVRKLLERLIRTIEPESRLLSFGSTANGFSLRNSDMDLCCLIDSEERLSASDLVTMLGDLLERETKFHVKPLPHARIPIVKLSLEPSPGLPYGIACDIGFENRLALENTRLLMCYAMIDPPRVRTMVLFLKVWCKRRKINSPYKGTLSSYGYVLLVIFFLVHVKNPPVLPNLQQMPALRPISPEETHLNGHNIWFFDDIRLLRQRWQSSNTESVAELLVDFFRYYSRDFNYNNGVVSIRAGLLKKDGKGWQSDSDRGTARERNRLCIEDPFEVDFNVSRCVTRDGLYTVRGELMRASRILASRPERAIVALAQLCEERKDEELLTASPSRPSSTNFIPPRLSPLPPQTPYTVGSNPLRAGPPDRLSPPQVHDPPPAFVQKAAMAQLPMLPDQQLDHMAPKRTKWTSPPPPEAPAEDREAFDTQLGRVFALATASSIRQREREPDTASEKSIITDEDFEENRSLAESDDVRSIRSFTDEGTVPFGVQLRPHPHQDFRSASFVPDPSSSRGNVQGDKAFFDPRMVSSGRLRDRPFRLGQQVSEAPTRQHQEQPPRLSVDSSSPRRSSSGPPPRAASHRFSMPVIPIYTPRPQVVTTSASQAQRAAVFYETSPLKERLSRALAAGTRSGESATPVPAVNVTPPYGSPLSATPVHDIGSGGIRGPMIQRSPSMESDLSTESPKQPVVNIPGHHEGELVFSIPQVPLQEQYSQYPQIRSHYLLQHDLQQYLGNEIPSASTTPLPASSSIPAISMDSSASVPYAHPLTQSYSQSHTHRLPSHSHSHSTATITAPTPPPQVLPVIQSRSALHTDTSPSHSPSQFPYNLDHYTRERSRSISRSPVQPLPSPSIPVSSHSPRLPSPNELPLGDRDLRSVSPMSDDESGSPSMISCSSSPARYAASVSPISTSPPSPRHSNVKLPPSSASGPVGSDAESKNLKEGVVEIGIAVPDVVENGEHDLVKETANLKIGAEE